MNGRRSSPGRTTTAGCSRCSAGCPSTRWRRPSGPTSATSSPGAEAARHDRARTPHPRRRHHRERKDHGGGGVGPPRRPPAHRTRHPALRAGLARGRHHRLLRAGRGHRGHKRVDHRRELRGRTPADLEPRAARGVAGLPAAGHLPPPAPAYAAPPGHPVQRGGPQPRAPRQALRPPLHPAVGAALARTAAPGVRTGRRRPHRRPAAHRPPPLGGGDRPLAARPGGGPGRRSPAGRRHRSRGRVTCGNPLDIPGVLLSTLSPMCAGRAAGPAFVVARARAAPHPVFAPSGGAAGVGPRRYSAAHADRQALPRAGLPGRRGHGSAPCRRAAGAAGGRGRRLLRGLPAAAAADRGLHAGRRDVAARRRGRVRAGAGELGVLRLRAAGPRRDAGQRGAALR
ncbi:hypothetical protein SBRY_30957 [Actinacidiphila bryophytorum]|uniref:Uncharacterized protein n=1 Tax=Actinacidiphila bryophytorum TaxID=1436133 RepID=A0A9W4H250_9ACTN|nr:hypothetical protein SBRY_30957 [Actinacidiphila bryophytorum]